MMAIRDAPYCRFMMPTAFATGISGERRRRKTRATKSSKSLFRTGLTPYYAALMDPDNPACPVRMQAIPRAAELESRTEELKEAHGVGFCNITKCCTKVCPESITITDNAIIPLKERVVDDFYDPLGKLLRRLRIL